MHEARLYSQKKLRGEKAQRTFTGPDALQVAMPLGGIGAGCICLNGYGGMQDFSVLHCPNISAMAEYNSFGQAAFALLHIKGAVPLTRLVEGPMPPERIYDQGLKGNGNWGGGHQGLPRFAKSSFRGEYPFGTVTLTDSKVPLKVRITGFGPFVPLDDKNSSIPCAILEYTLTNRSRKTIRYEFSYHVSQFVPGRDGGKGSLNEVIPGGVCMYNREHRHSETFGSNAVTVVGHRPKVKAAWFRGGWFDAISALWREVSEGRFRSNRGCDTSQPGRNGGSVMLAGTLKGGASVTYPIVLTWYYPNCHQTIGLAGVGACGCGGEGGRKNPPPKWRPYYASQWSDARDVALYVRKNYASLRARTQAFHDALFGSTLPSYVLDAVSANLAIIKSPTVLRLANGDIWAWEGCFCDSGCCHGSCTHVWNYAQAFPHLFPQLERTLREAELIRSMDRNGHVTFRSALPEGPTPHTFHAASDGQLGGIMKVWREWQISGDRTWLKKMYPLAKKSLDYCIRTWDPPKRGVLAEPHHNTYDIEFWGPDGMCSSFYIGALAAMAQMAADLQKRGDAARYRKLATKGAKFLDEKLFNGEYFTQKVQFAGLRDKSFVKFLKKVNAASGERDKLLKKEGPPYQYGRGCISDGVLGAWMARIYGIDTPQTRKNIRRHLQAVFKYNFRPDLFEHANCQRPGFAIGHDAGLLLCTWPRGGKPTLPFVYSDEVWTGIEYQVASHLIEEGMVDEGLTIVQAVRDRYDGRRRNPWNEYECGSYYARAMSSYALLGSLSGFRYSAAMKTLWFGPKLKARPFRAFFSTAGGFGTITLRGDSLAIEMIEGSLEVAKVHLSIGGVERTIDCSLQARPGGKAVLRNLRAR